jgi:serine/threonine protein kinase
MQFCGTPTYMAQELFLKKAYDETVDIFALGTLFYEVYAGEVPYAGMDPGDIK